MHGVCSLSDDDTTALVIWFVPTAFFSITTLIKMQHGRSLEMIEANLIARCHAILNKLLQCVYNAMYTAVQTSINII